MFVYWSGQAVIEVHSEDCLHHHVHGEDCTECQHKHHSASPTLYVA